MEAPDEAPGLPRTWDSCFESVCNCFAIASVHSSRLNATVRYSISFPREMWSPLHVHLFGTRTLNLKANLPVVPKFPSPPGAHGFVGLNGMLDPELSKAEDIPADRVFSRHGCAV